MLAAQNHNQFYCRQKRLRDQTYVVRVSSCHANAVLSGGSIILLQLLRNSPVKSPHTGLLVYPRFMGFHFKIRLLQLHRCNCRLLLASSNIGLHTHACATVYYTEIDKYIYLCILQIMFNKAYVICNVLRARAFVRMLVRYNSCSIVFDYVY